MVVMMLYINQFKLIHGQIYVIFFQRGIIGIVLI